MAGERDRAVERGRILVAANTRHFNAALAAESSAEALRRYLAEQEWSAWRSSDGGREDFIGAECCPECAGTKAEGHADGCRLATLLETSLAALSPSPAPAPAEGTSGDGGGKP